MKRKVSDPTNINASIAPPKKRKIENNEQQNTKTNHCKYWKMSQSFIENGYWIISKLQLSSNLDRIGIVLSRKTNNRFKIMILQRNIESNMRNTTIWTEEGRISSMDHIVLNHSLSVCVVAYQCDDIDVHTITNIDSISHQNISINHGKYSDPHIAFIQISNTQMILITKRGMLHTRDLTESDISDSTPPFQLIHTRIHIMHGNSDIHKYMVLSRGATDNKLLLYDKSTKYDVKINVNAIQKNAFQSIITDASVKRVILMSTESIICVDMNEKNDAQYGMEEDNNLEEHNNGSISFDVNGLNVASKASYFESMVVFEQNVSSQMKVLNFYDSNTIIGYDANHLIMWRICDALQTKQVLTRTALVFDGDICGVISEYQPEIPQQLMIRFIDDKKRPFTIDGVDDKNGVVMLCDPFDEVIGFKLDYLMVLNEANNSKCLHIFTIALPLISEQDVM